ncbi:MAG: HD domain-containing protein [Candidatus Bipolaricaulota bacterium]
MRQKGRTKTSSVLGDAQLLDDNDCTELLQPHETIRDPVHGDIRLTALERAIIDTPDFQRLRGLKQLGTTDLVYPGATHNRFLHSIGTMHVADEMCEIVNDNACVYPEGSLQRIGPYPRLLIRLSALLHDLCNVPFGHALEDEGSLSDGRTQWDHGDRRRRWFGPEQDVPQAVTRFLIKMDVDTQAAQKFVKELELYTVTRDREVVLLRYPYVVDIVRNTLCADMLDYLERDMLFCGLRERTGDRAVKYLALLHLRPVRARPREGDADNDEAADRISHFLPCTPESHAEGRDRLVLLAYRQERQHEPRAPHKTVQKNDVLTEAIDLLRRRFFLAEKVHCHRTKVASSAMLISAVGTALESGSLDWETMYTYSDEGLLSALAGIDSHRIGHLMAQYKNRALYNAPYFVAYRKKQDSDAESVRLWDTVVPRLRDWKKRLKAERQIEQFFKLPEGSVAIYCPKREMNVKAFDMLVQSRPGSDVKRLGTILDESRRAEMDAINTRFAQLWQLRVFVDSTVLSDAGVGLPDVAVVAEYVIEFPNSSNETSHDRAVVDELCVDRAIAEKGMSRADVPLVVRDRMLAQVANRKTHPGSSGLEDRIAWMGDELDRWVNEGVSDPQRDGISRVFTDAELPLGDSVKRD